MERRSTVIIIVSIIAAIALFGYSQYVLATHFTVSILESKVIQRGDANTLYNMTLQFKNPSLIPLNVGKTDFIISVNDENLGTGTLQPIIISPIGKTVSTAPFLADNTVLHKYDTNENAPSVKLSGTSKYEIMIISVDVPFVYYPTQEESRAFIHGS